MSEKQFSFGLKLKFEDRTDLNTVFLECVTPNHNKFYYLFLRENIGDFEYPYKVICYFGKISTEGNTKTSKFKTKELAREFFNQKVKDKTSINKGYKRVSTPQNPVVNAFSKSK